MTEIDVTNEPRSKNFKDRTGEKIAMLTVVKLHKIVKIPEYKKPDGSARTKVFWECKCECGNVCIKNNDVLNNTRRNFSCGCLRSEKAKTMHNTSNEQHKHTIINATYNRYRCEAKKRGYSFDLTKEQFHDIVQKACYYCGKSDTQYIVHPRTKVKHTFSGVDRIDNSRGYSIDNVITCCKHCNTLKGGITSDMVKKVYNLLKERGIIEDD